MSSLLLTVLALTGLFCCPYLISPVQAADCATEIAKCPQYVHFKTSAELNTLCSAQSTRKTCYNNLPSSCKTTTINNQLAASEYICQSSIKSAVSSLFLNCMEPNQPNIQRIFNSCASGIASGLSESCRGNELRRCIAKALTSCCSNACQYQDTYLYHLFRPASVDANCPWKSVSGYCGGASTSCSSGRK